MKKYTLYIALLGLTYVVCAPSKSIAKQYARYSLALTQTDELVFIDVRPL